MRYLIGAALASGLLAGCGGSAREFVGVTDVDVDASGTVAGLSEQSLTVFETDVGIFAHGFVEGVDALVIGNSSSAVAGDIGNFAASGIVDGYDVGGSYVSGTASYSGDYAMTVVSGYEESPNPQNWQRQALTGEFIARIELHTAVAAANDPDHGHSHDVDVVELSIGEEGDPLFFEEVIIYSPTPPALPSTILNTFNGGFANVGSGAPVPLEGKIAFGSDGIIASFQGQTADHLVAGGFGGTDANASDLVTQ